MKRQKRDKIERAYIKGYHSGVAGKSQDGCPHIDERQRQSWMMGWREGRVDNWDGMVGVSGVHKLGTIEQAAVQ